MSKSNISASQRNSTRNTRWVVRPDSEAEFEHLKQSYESYEDKQKRLRRMGL